MACRIWKKTTSSEDDLNHIQDTGWGKVRDLRESRIDAGCTGHSYDVGREQAGLMQVSEKVEVKKGMIKVEGED